MKQSLDLAVTRVMNTRMKEFANVIREYEKRINAFGDDTSEWKTIYALRNIRDGLILAFYVIFDKEYDEYKK